LIETEDSVFKNNFASSLLFRLSSLINLVNVALNTSIFGLFWPRVSLQFICCRKNYYLHLLGIFASIACPEARDALVTEPLATRTWFKSQVWLDICVTIISVNALEINFSYSKTIQRFLVVRDR